MTQAVQLSVDVAPLLRSLQQMPAQMRVNILVPAAKKSARILVRAIRPLIPRQKRQRKPAVHYQDAMTSVVRQYDMTQSVVAVVGPESKMAPHAHLVEDGTADRYTNHKTRYRRTAIRAREIIKGGRLKFVTEKQRISVGSFIRKKNKPTFFRGRMPAFHAMRRGIQAAQAAVSSQLKMDIEAGIKREFTQAQIARSK